MSKEQIQWMQNLITWLTRCTVITLASVVLYFVKDIHSTVKTNHKTIEQHNVRITILETKIHKP